MNRDEVTLTAAKVLLSRLTIGSFPGGEVQKVAHIQVFLNELLDAELLASHPPSANPAGKVAGYTDQPSEKVALVNGFKQDEERLLRKIEKAERDGVLPNANYRDPLHDFMIYGRDFWVNEAVRQFTAGFMALNRAVFQPQRIKLPEDGE